MEICDEFVIPANQSAVWTLFRDVPRLVQLLPGCSDVKQLDDTHYHAKMENRVKFMTIKFNVDGELVNERDGSHLEAQMTGKPVALAGYFRTTLTVDLESLGHEKTQVTYVMNTSMTGRLASFGELLMRPVVEDTAKQFTQNIIQQFDPVAK